MFKGLKPTEKPGILKIAISVTWSQHYNGIFLVSSQGMTTFVMILHFSLDRRHVSCDREWRQTLMHAVVKIIRGLTVEINSAALKAAGSRPWCTKLTAHKRCLQRKQRSPIVFAVVAKHAEKKNNKRTVQQQQSEQAPFKTCLNVFDSRSEDCTGNQGSFCTTRTCSQKRELSVREIKKTAGAFVKI